MTKKCVVPGCGANLKTNGAVFYKFASPLETLQVQSLQRSQRWVEALGFRQSYNTKNKKICNKHFVSGKPAKLTDVGNVDWIPSLNIPVAVTGVDLDSTGLSGHNDDSDSTTHNDACISQSDTSSSQCTNFHDDSEVSERQPDLEDDGYQQSTIESLPIPRVVREDELELEILRLQKTVDRLQSQALKGRRGMAWIANDDMCKRKPPNKA